MKDTFYFSHDYNTRSDEKIVKLLRKHGMTGYGIFWGIVEMLYNNENSLKMDCDDIAYELRADAMMIESIINDFDLFVINNGYFGSDSIENRLSERDKISERARQKAFKRWRKDTDVPKNDATASKNDATASKNDAGKEIKEIKERKERIETPLPDKPADEKLDFIQSIIDTFLVVFTDYKIVTPGKERAAAGKLLRFFKKKYPGLDEEGMLLKLSEFFESCKTIQDPWYKANMSLTTMVTKYNTIHAMLTDTRGKQDLTQMDYEGGLK